MFASVIKFCKNNWILISITVLAAITRILWLTVLPNGLHDDEIDAGYIGKYLLIHGKDIYGNSFPLYIDKFGDFRPMGTFLLSGLGSIIFGNSVFAIRSIPALLGIVTIISIYFLAKTLTQNKTIGLCCAFLLALLPWHIVLSRATSDGISGLLFFVIGLTLLFNGIQNKNKNLFIWTTVSFVISYFFYHPFRLLIPLCILPLCFVYWKHHDIRKKLLGIFLITVVCTGLIAFSAAGTGRFNQVAFYKNPFLSLTSERLIQSEGTNHVLLARIFHNKVVLDTREFFQQYLSYFSPSFLFLNGGLPLRYQIPEQGLVQISCIILLISSFFWNPKLGEQWKKWYIFYLLLLAPFPAAITFDDAPNMHRSLIMIIPLILLSGIGLHILIETGKKFTWVKLFLIVFSVCYIGETIYFFHQYSVHAPSNKSVVRNDGAKKLISYVIANKNLYGQIVLPAEFDLPLYYLYFSNNYSLLPKGSVFPGNQIQQVGSIKFVLKNECPSHEIQNKQTKNVLFIDAGNCSISKNATVVKEMYRKDSTRAFRMLKM